MMKYYKNFILCGVIEFHCILCSETFHTIDEVERHIRWEKHRRILKVQHYLTKFQKDRVYKVNNIYYCEYCNHLSPTLLTMSSHVNEEVHKTNRANPRTELKKSFATFDSGIITIFSNIIKKNEWNAVIKSYCLICHVDVTKLDEHVSLPSHVIRLIQTEIVQDGDQFYRKIDPGNIFCFTCKKVVFTSIEKHRTTKRHVSRGIRITDTKEKKYFEHVNKRTIRCLECLQLLDCDYRTLVIHRSIHCEDIEDGHEEITKLLGLIDHGKRRAQLKAYGMQHYIKLDEGGRKGNCELCNNYISPHMNSFQKHVEGSRHQAFLDLKLPKKNKKLDETTLRTLTFQELCIHIICVDEKSLVMINKEFCLEFMSLILHSPLYNNKVLCYICDKRWSGHFRDHLSFHINDLKNTKTIIGIPNELYREIRPGVYHCGNCNIIQPGWSFVEKHRGHWKHEEKCSNIRELIRLQINMPEQPSMTLGKILEYASKL